jgi:hypothetical protein
MVRIEFGDRQRTHARAGEKLAEHLAARA